MRALSILMIVALPFSLCGGAALGDADAPNQAVPLPMPPGSGAADPPMLNIPGLPPIPMPKGSRIFGPNGPQGTTAPDAHRGGQADRTAEAPSADENKPTEPLGPQVARA